MLPMKLTSTVGTVALVALTAPAVSADFNSYYDHVLRRDGSGGGHSHGGGGSSGGHGGSSGGHGGGGSNIQSASSNYQAPASSYQAPSSGYQSPSSGYQSPSSGYDSNNQGYNQPSSGYGGGGGDNSYGGGVTGSGYGNEPSFPDLTPIILGILVLTGLSLLFPSYVSLTSVKRKRRDADEGTCESKISSPDFSSFSLLPTQMLLYQGTYSFCSSIHSHISFCLSY